MRLIARYLCVLGTPLSYAKTAESVEMGELQTCVSSRNRVLDWGPDPPRIGAVLRGKTVRSVVKYTQGLFIIQYWPDSATTATNC